MVSLETHTSKHNPSHAEQHKRWKHVRLLDENAAGTKENKRMNRHEHAQNLDLTLPKHERQEAVEKHVRQQHLVFENLVNVRTKHCQVKLLLIVILSMNQGGETSKQIYHFILVQFLIDSVKLTSPKHVYLTTWKLFSFFTLT